MLARAQVIIGSLLIYYIAGGEIKNNGSEIILVHVLFRHGARTPIEFYPKDPHKNETFYPMGLGELTNKGKMMMFRVGDLLRKEYGTLLGNDYTANKIATRSTGINRTIMSALLVLAALWPPSKTQKWHETLAWIPIPVFAKPFEAEDLLNPAFCQYSRTLINRLPDNVALYNKYIEPYKDFFERIQQNSGKEVQDLTDIMELFFTLQTETENGLTIPPWAKEIYTEFQRIVPLVYEYVNVDPILESIQSGYLIKKIINDSKSKINGDVSLKDKVMYLYSAHDTNIGGIRNALKLPLREMPGYGSSVIFELHRFNNKFYIKVRYLKNAMQTGFEDLKHPDCEILCPFDQFIKLHEAILPTSSYEEVCSRQ